jgi:quercetin dioxygenase-like cupin family protein
MSSSKALTISDLVEFARQGTVSKTLLDVPHVKVTLFCMSAGQELTEHTAGHPVTIHFLEGEGEFVLGRESHAIVPGAWFYLEARAPHALKIRANTVFVLTLLRS